MKNKMFSLYCCTSLVGILIVEAWLCVVYSHYPLTPQVLKFKYMKPQHFEYRTTVE